MGNNNSLTRQYGGALNIAAFIIIIAGVIYAESLIAQILMALFISIIFAQPIAWLQKKKVPQGLAITMVFIFIIAVFVGFGELIGTSMSSFSEDAPKYEQNLREMGAAIFQFADNQGIKISTDEMTKLFDPSKIMSITAGLLGSWVVLWVMHSPFSSLCFSC